VSWPKLEQRKVALVARRDLRDAVSELRLIIAMVGLTLAIPIGVGSGVRAMALFGGGTAVVNRLSLVGAFFVVFIPASFSLVLALESFVGERERTTLERRLELTDAASADRRLDVVDRAVVLQVSPGRHALIESGDLRHESDARPDAGGIVGRIDAVDPDLARAWHQHTGHASQRGRLARAVAAEQDQALARLDAHGELLERGHIAIALGQVADFQHG